MKNLLWTLTIAEQLSIWSKMFPRKTMCLSDKEKQQSKNAPWVVIPNPRAIANDYYAATRRMFRMLNEHHGTTMGFVDSHSIAAGQEYDMAYMEYHIVPERLRLRSRTARAHRLLGINRRGPYIDYWWKLRLCYGEEREGLVPEIRSKMATNEFGLGPYEAACLFLLAPIQLPEFESYPVAIGCDYRTEGEDDIFDEPEREIGYFQHSLSFGGYFNSISHHGHRFGWGTSTRVLTGYIDRNLSKYDA